MQIESSDGLAVLYPSLFSTYLFGINASPIAWSLADSLPLLYSFHSLNTDCFFVPFLVLD